MSDIRANTISDAAGTGPIDLYKQSAAKVWVNFNGTGTIAIRDSFNVSSLTDNGSGDYDVNFTSSFDSVNHAGSGLAGDDGHFASYRNGIGLNSASMANIAITIYSGSRTDMDLVTFVTNGDLA